MKKLITNKSALIKLVLMIITIFFVAGVVSAKQGPLFYLIPVENHVFVILGDTPREVYGFKVLRKGPGEKKYKELTPDPIVPFRDPYKVREVLGKDYKWIAKKVGTEDPALLWQRLKGNRNLTMLLCLVSHRLRIATGRTYFDKCPLIKGKTYSYRIVFINTLGKTVLSKAKKVNIGPLKEQKNPTKVNVTAGDSMVSITWEYPSYTGSDKDLTVGFNIYRKEKNKGFVKINPAPVFRVEKGLYFLDEKVENGKEYIYGVTPVDLVGNEGKMVRSKPVKPIDKTSPLVPMGLTAKDTERGVLLLWKFSPEVDFDHYNVFRSTSLRGQYEQINSKPLTNPRFVDSSIVRGNPYYYKVVAIDKSGNESKPSGAVNIIPRDLSPPGPVKGIKFEIDKENRYVTLKWQSSVEKDLKGYFIYRGTSKERLLRLNSKPYVVKEDEPSYIDKGYKNRGLRPGKHLFYGISACDNSYNEGPVTTIELDVPDNVPPHPVFMFSAEITPEGWVRLVWQPSLSSDLFQHRIYRFASKSKEAELIAKIKKEATAYIDKTAQKGKKVSYYVTEVDKSGNESAKSKVVEVVPTDITAPGQPKNLSISSERRKLRLSWMGPEDNDIAGYNVWLSKDGEKWIKLNKSLVQDLTITVKNRGTAYYAVSAVDTSGNQGKKNVKKYEEIK